MSSILKVVLLILLLASLYAVRTGSDRREKARQFANDMRELTREGTDAVRQEFERDGAISPATSAKLMSRIQGQLDAAASVGGDEGKALQIISGYAADLKKYMESYDLLVKRAASEQLWDFGRVKQKSDLDRHRDIALQLLNLNRDLRAFLEGTESTIRAKFQAAGLTGPNPEKMLTGFSRGFGTRLPVQLRIRDSDEIMSQSLLEICDLLEANWGKWRVENGAITFDSDTVLARYNAISKRADKAEADQAAAQRELISLQRR